MYTKLWYVNHGYGHTVGESGAQINMGHVETWGFCIVTFEQE